MTILIKKSTTANFEAIEINDTPLGKGGQGAVHNITTSKYSADYWAHLQSSVGNYPKIVHSLNMKKGRSDTPLS